MKLKRFVFEAPRAAMRRVLVPGSMVTSIMCVLTGLALLLQPSPPGALAEDYGASATTVRAADAGQAEVGYAPVWVTRVEGIVDPPMASYLVGTMQKAADAEAAALVIQMDTPGGLDTAMRDIIQAEIECAIPVIVYVHPQGARAASAGVYILMGSDVAAMAPQTNLGAATPVSLGEEMDEVMQAKVTNDAAAYIIGLAETHGRNAEWAEQAVREAVSLPAEDAQEQNVVEFVAEDLEALLQAVDGYVTTPKDLTIRTARAPIKEVGMGWVQRFLHAIANPDIAYILMSIGMLGIFLEFSTPGLGASGIAGVIALVLSFYSFQVLPVSLAGIALVVLALILFVAELLIQSHGILGVGATASLVLGGLLLFDTPAPYLKVSWPIAVGVGVVALLMLTIVVSKVAKAMRRRPATGTEGLVGTTGVVISPLSPVGQVRLHGEIWKARVEGGDLLEDGPVEVLRTEGLTLVVRSLTDPGPESQDK